MDSCETKKYKLYYLNKFGQMTCSDDNLCHKKNCFEIYTTLDEAKVKAKIFVDKNPIMSCVIFDDEDNQEIIIEAEKEKVEKAWQEEHEKNRLLFEAYEKKQKRFKYFVFSVLIFLILFLLIG